MDYCNISEKREEYVFDSEDYLAVVEKTNV